MFQINNVWLEGSSSFQRACLYIIQAGKDGEGHSTLLKGSRMGVSLWEPSARETNWAVCSQWPEAIRLGLAWGLNS